MKNIFLFVLTGFLFSAIFYCKTQPAVKPQEIPKEVKSLSHVERENPVTHLKEIEVLDQEGAEIGEGAVKSRYLFEHTEPRPDEAFRVFITSDEYFVKQFLHQDTLLRQVDAMGDQFVREGLVPYNKVNFSDEASIEIILSSITGKITRVSVDKVARIRKITSLLNDDATRWTFTFPKEIIEPKQFKVYYFFALQGSADKEAVKEFLKSRVTSW